ncbi:hypothetical protein [Sinorhizobium meliloti]|jgi:hypothetical protein|uniref:hypothetical protein n=1 Tax=Rhizobium meliloti TaxID=382 RepID=UPI0020BE8EDD|nr:hypothetical protein [Sinorhizobium meliloti]
MIPQLVERIRVGVPLPIDQAREAVLTSDPLDLVLHLEQVWAAYDPVATGPLPILPARRTLMMSGQFAAFAPGANERAWEHLGYSYVLENTRGVQIFKRIVREYRSGLALGIPSPATLRWLDASEALLFGAANPFSGWLTTSPAGADGEIARRRAYWQLFGLDLAFGTDDNRPPVYDKGTAANTGFVALFEELLFEVWQAITNLKNFSGVNSSDNDRIFRLAEALMFMLRARRQGPLNTAGTVLLREELAAATVLGWIDLTLSFNSSLVMDAGAQATSAAGRLANLGAKVGLPAHSRSTSLFEMSAELSKILRVIESGVVTGPEFAYILYREQPPVPGVKVYGAEARRVITEWAAATGKDLKARGKPVEMASRRRLIAVK